MSILLGPFDDAEAPKEIKEDEQLLVFGYACKLFRDDSKALLESSGQLLIPWMGDNSLMVDRYDARNRLDDKSQFGVKSNLPYRMSAKERELEEALDQERYLALHWDDIRVEEQEEEERRRASENSLYSAIGFSYNDEPSKTPPTSNAPPPSERVQPVTSVEVEEGEEFVLPHGLIVPDGMKLPATKKLHSIIVRTVLFVCQQGPQMEIIIKTKQQSNPLFSFLNLSDPLYPYYSHLKTAVASGSYVPHVETADTKPTENGTQESGLDKETEESEGNESKENDQSVPTVVYGPHPEPGKVEVQSSSSEEESDLDSDDEDGYLHPLLLQAMNPRSKSSTPTSTIPVTKEATPPHEDVPTLSAVTFRAKSMVVNAAPELRKEPVGSVGETTASLSTSGGHYASHAHSEPPPQYISPAAPYPDVGSYPPNSHDSQYYHYPHAPPPDQYYEAYLAAASRYHTSAPPPQNEALPTTSVPPPDLRSIVDKTAAYVVKNGNGFEATVLKRHLDDPRFGFLNPWGEYHSYYCQQKQILVQQQATREHSSGGHSSPAVPSEWPGGVQRLSSSGAVSFKLQSKMAKVVPDGSHFVDESAQEAGNEAAPEPPVKKMRVEEQHKEEIGSTFKEFLSTVKNMFSPSRTTSS